MKSANQFKRMVSDIVYPFFLEACKYTDDEYWKVIFTNAANGKFPANYMYKEYQLHFRHKKRPEKIQLPIDDHQLLCDVCILFFQKTSGMMSEMDKMKQGQKCIDDASDKKQPQKWTQIKWLGHKKMLIDRFITFTSKYYKLNKKEEAQLENCIYMGLSLKAVDIKLSVEGKIQEVVGLRFDEEIRIFYFDKPKYKAKKISTTELSMVRNPHEPDPTYFMKQFTKFIKAMTKKDVSSQQSIYDQASVIHSNTPLVQTPLS